jgi:hypothetical protein
MENEFYLSKHCHHLEGASKFPALLKGATPGILFIDEVYQLDPNGNADGRAITNALMEAAENDRSKLTVIVAGDRYMFIHFLTGK